MTRRNTELISLSSLTVAGLVSKLNVSQTHWFLHWDVSAYHRGASTHNLPCFSPSANRRSARRWSRRA